MTDDPRAPAADRCGRCEASLPEDATFCAECGQVRSAIRGDAEASRRRSPWLLPAAIGGAVAAVGGGVLFAIAISGPREAAQSSVTPTPSPTAIASAAESASEGPTASPSPTITAIPILPNRAIAIVSVDALNLRAGASESAESLGVMTAGEQVFVIGAPEEAGELRWYRVAAGFSATPCESGDCLSAIGWVATPMTGDDRWIEEAIVECPSSPLTADQLIDMPPLVRLHCYGNQDLTGTGWVDNHCCGYVGPISFTPSWLAYPPGHFFRASDFYDTMYYRLVPGAGEEWVGEWPVPGDIIRFTGHFEDPAAPTCRTSLSEDPNYADVTGVEVPDPAVAVLTCRLQFVVTEYEVIGHEGEGSCGCLAPPPSPSAGAGRAPEAYALRPQSVT
jgi:hypothetical protein